MQAIQVTPQYGDSFIELLRLELLENGEYCSIQDVLKNIRETAPNHGEIWNVCRPHAYVSLAQTFRVAKRFILDDMSVSVSAYALKLDMESRFPRFAKTDKEPGPGAYKQLLSALGLTNISFADYAPHLNRYLRWHFLVGQTFQANGFD